uniref:Anoctamin n=1 Tax=Ascaris lumbricoides TaxID=6252 RepID=A0A0M3HVN4_ASCLU
MFDEEEPGKPKNWGCTVAIIVLMMTMNIAVLVVCRVLLDSEDEFNEPILRGESTIYYSFYNITNQQPISDSILCRMDPNQYLT